MSIAAGLTRSPSLERVRTLATSFGRWWAGELRAHVSVRWMQWLVGPPRPVLQLAVTDDAIKLSLLNGQHVSASPSRFTASEYTASTIDTFLASQHLLRKDVDIIIQLPFERFFGRTLFLPEGVHNVNDMVERDLSKKLPFRLDEIYHHQSIERSNNAKRLDVQQWVVKRKYVEHALSRLQMTESEVAFVSSDNVPSGLNAPIIPLADGSARSVAWYWSSTRLLVCSAIILSVVAVGSKYFSQRSMLDGLDREIASTSAKAREVRARLDSLERKQAATMRLSIEKTTKPSLLEVWEKVTEILPDHSWLTELQLSQVGAKTTEQQLNLNGFSDAAASLVGQFDGSPLFQDASLTSPVTVDPVEKRERFSMQMKIRGLDVVKAAGH